MTIAAGDYDEFGLFHENAAEAGIPLERPPAVERLAHTLDDGRTLRGLRWGTEPPEFVFLHGGGQNAHTWDTVALALDRPLLAIDLPGHGHSDDISHDRPIGPRSLAADVGQMIEVHTSSATVLVGMSLGGLTAMTWTAMVPEPLPKLVMVDVTPGAGEGDKTSEIRNFLAGPESFESFEEILERTMAFNPTRSEASLRRGILHNATQRADGRWVWRHQRERPALPTADDAGHDLGLGSLWDDLERVRIPVLLLLGDRSPVVDEDDVHEFRRRAPHAEVTTVPDAGHSIQGDQPLALAEHLARFHQH